MSQTQYLSLDLSKLYQGSVPSASISLHNAVADPLDREVKTERANIAAPLGSPLHDREVVQSATERIVRSKRVKNAVGMKRPVPIVKATLKVDGDHLSASFMQVTHFEEGPLQRPKLQGRNNPLGVLEAAMRNEQMTSKLPSLSKVDVLPPALGSSLEFTDSVADEDVDIKKNRRAKERLSKLSFMSSLSDNLSAKNSSVFESYSGPRMVMGVGEDLPFDTSAFPAPSKPVNTMNSQVYRRDREIHRAQESLRDRLYRDFQLVKQMQRGASIMRGVSYRRGVKGSNIAQRYRANLEKIVFIKNVYTQGHWRNAYLKQLERKSKGPTTLSANSLASSMLQESSIASGYSCIRAPPAQPSQPSVGQQSIAQRAPMEGLQFGFSDDDGPNASGVNRDGNQEALLQVPVRPRSLPSSTAATRAGSRKQRWTPRQTPQSASSQLHQQQQQPPGTGDDMAAASLLPRAGDLLPEALNLDPAAHVFSPQKQHQQVVREQLRARYKFDDQEVPVRPLPPSLSGMSPPTGSTQLLTHSSSACRSGVGGGRSLELASAVFLQDSAASQYETLDHSTNHRSDHVTFLSPELRRAKREARAQRKRKPSGGVQLVGRDLAVQAVAVPPLQPSPPTMEHKTRKSPRMMRHVQPQSHNNSSSSVQGTAADQLPETLT